MAKILNLSEIITCLEDMKSPAAEDLRKSALHLADTAAELLAERLGVSNGPPDMWDGNLFVAFRPTHEGQAMPDCLDEMDPDGDWE